MTRSLAFKVLGGMLIALVLWLAVFPGSAGRWVGTFKAGVSVGERTEVRRSMGLPPDRQ